MPGNDSPKYSCACGLSQDEKKRKWFAERCPLCRTKAKYPLRQQGSFDSATSARASGEQRTSELRGSDRSRSEERLHGCQVTDVPPPLYSRRPPQRESSTEWLDPAALSTSPPPPYNTVRNPCDLPSYEQVSGNRRRLAEQSTTAAGASAATSMAEAQNYHVGCECYPAEVDHREYQRQMDQYAEMGGRICSCAKCQERYHELYQQMNDDSALPMATPMLMQDVLTDGLAFCSVM